INIQRVKKIVPGFALLFTLQSNILSAQVLETEESKPLLPKQFEIGSGLEFQTSKEGTETALPLAIEYGLSKHFTLLIEPVGFTNIRSKTGPLAKGVGDLEVTLFYQLMAEKNGWPSISVSGEIKIPTAKNKFIGTGKTDFTPFFIASKTTGRFFTSLNLSYTFLRKPQGVVANNLYNYALGTIYTASSKSIFFGEVYGNTSAGGGETADGSIPPNLAGQTTEIAGGETVVAIGYGYYLKKELQFSF